MTPVAPVLKRGLSSSSSSKSSWLTLLNDTSHVSTRAADLLTLISELYFRKMWRIFRCFIVALENRPASPRRHPATDTVALVVACCREAVQAAFAEAKGMAWGQPGVDSLRSKLKARQGDLQLSMAAADSVMKETIR